MLLLLCFLIHAVTAQNVNPTAELAIPTEAQTNEANAEIKTQSVTVQTKISKCLIYYMSFYAFHSINRYVFFHLKDNFLFHKFFLI